MFKNKIVMKEAFTLIELLIVVAIIAILAAIAVPNFLEAQTRAKVSRMKADARAIATACQAYYVDNNAYQYPVNGDYSTFDLRQGHLTTPISYLSSLPSDVFRSVHPDNPNNLFDVEAKGAIPDIWFQIDPNTPMLDFDIDVYIRSWGPDQTQAVGSDDQGPGLDVHPTTKAFGWAKHHVYDPTNGTISTGDIWAVLPGPIFMP